MHNNEQSILNFFRYKNSNLISCLGNVLFTTNLRVLQTEFYSSEAHDPLTGAHESYYSNGLPTGQLPTQISNCTHNTISIAYSNLKNIIDSINDLLIDIYETGFVRWNENSGPSTLGN